MSCDICNASGYDDVSCPLNPDSTYHKPCICTCAACGQYMSCAHLLCESCWHTMHGEVQAYHKLQDEAHNDILTGNVPEAIIKLTAEIKARNYASRFFDDNIRSSRHYYFANVFLPELIENLRVSSDPAKEWDHMFATYTYKKTE